MPNATGLTTFPSKSPSLNHSRFGTARSAGFPMAIMAKTTATLRAHHRGISPWNNGQPAISRNTPANTKPNERSVDPSTCCSRDKSSCAMAHHPPFQLIEPGPLQFLGNLLRLYSILTDDLPALKNLWLAQARFRIPKSEPPFSAVRYH